MRRVEALKPGEEWLHGIVGGLGVATKVATNRDLPGRRPFLPSFRWPVAAGGPAAAPAAPAKAPRCSGPWCA